MSIIPVSPPTIDPTRQGTFASSRLGNGSFDTEIQKVGNTKNVDTTLSLADGKSIQKDRTVTKNADGSVTVDRTRTLADGKTVTSDTTRGAVNADGSRTITSTRTGADGNTFTVNGTATKSTNGDVSLTLTNAQGQTETLDRTATVVGNTRTVDTTGENFRGKAIANSTVWTVQETT